MPSTYCSVRQKSCCAEGVKDDKRPERGQSQHATCQGSTQQGHLAAFGEVKASFQRKQHLSKEQKLAKQRREGHSPVQREEHMARLRVGEKSTCLGTSSCRGTEFQVGWSHTGLRTSLTSGKLLRIPKSFCLLMFNWTLKQKILKRKNSQAHIPLVVIRVMRSSHTSQPWPTPLCAA